MFHLYKLIHFPQISSMFELSKMTKISLLIGVTGVALFGLGYTISSVTGFVDEVTDAPKMVEMQEMSSIQDDTNFDSNEEPINTYNYSELSSEESL